MTKRVLIVGLGIAGMASAISLKNNGWAPVIIERAPERRTGGYFIGVQDAGKEAAEKLGVLKDFHIRTPENSENWHMTKDGGRVRVAGFADQPARPATLLRGDIEEGLWHSVNGVIEVRFGWTPIAITDLGNQVEVRLQNKGGEEVTEHFDLVVGGDGLRSATRKLVFGEHDQFMKSLDCIICAYQLENQMETFKSRDGILLNDNEQRSLWIFPLQDHSPTALFTYRTDDVDAQFKRPVVDLLRERFEGLDNSGIVDEALDDLANSKDYLFDSVNEVHMDIWHKGRIVLVGDSAWCLTLFSGMGATAAIVGGQALGDALAAHDGRIEAGLEAWEATMRPFINKERKLVWLKSQMFVPSNTFFFVLRRIILRFGGRYLAKLSGEHKTPQVKKAV